MPELPEVETVAEGMRAALTGRVCESVALRRKNLRFPFPQDFAERLEGRVVKEISRRSKYILITMDDGTVLIIHLGMSGKILIRDGMPNDLAKHDHVIFRFKHGPVAIYNDARRFGAMDLTTTQTMADHPLLRHIGPEPLDREFTEEVLYNTLKNKKTSIKSALMDQRIVAGLGNIYVCESLFRSGLSPLKKCHTITKKQAAVLLSHIRDVLREAIASGGSTLRDYVRSDGDLGYFQHHFQVYGRENAHCYNRDTGIIKRIAQQGRSTFYCPVCQL